MDLFEDFKNPDGKTYNGIKMLQALTGLPEGEIKWMAERIGQLIRQKIPKNEALIIVKEEAKSKPWEGK